MKRFRLRLLAKKPCDLERSSEQLASDEAEEQNTRDVDMSSCCLTSQPSDMEHSEVCRRGSMGIYDAATLRSPSRGIKSTRGISNKSALSELMRSTVESQLRDETDAACGAIREHIAAERRRQREEVLIDDVIRDGEIVLARYEHNSNERGLLLGMKRYKKSQAEYERSVKIVRQLSDLEKRLRSVRDYQIAQRLLETYESDMQQILSIPTDWPGTEALETSLLDELTSGRVQDYVAGLVDHQARRKPKT
jgi:dGTP triphosphohydrolase